MGDLRTIQRIILDEGSVPSIDEALTRVFSFCRRYVSFYRTKM